MAIEHEHSRTARSRAANVAMLEDKSPDLYLPVYRMIRQVVTTSRRYVLP
jgi:hypothetical protein